MAVAVTTESSPASVWARPFLFLAPALISLVGFQLARVAALVAFGGADLSTVSSGELAACLFTGLRFDLKLLAITWVIPWLFSVMAVFWVPRWEARARRLTRGWFILTLALFNIAAALNLLYQDYYLVPFDPALFGVVDDDTLVVLLTIWEDVPLLRVIGLIILFTWAQYRLWRRIELPPLYTAGPARVVWRKGRVPAVVLIFMAMSFLARGRLDSQPINQDDFTVSPNQLLCDVVPNGMTAFYYAWRDYKLQIRLSDNPREGLRDFKFRSVLEAAAGFGLQAGSERDVLEQLQVVTPERPALRKSPPHVLVILMESWDARTIEQHGPGRDLLGRFAKHREEGYWFPRFTSIGRGTHPTMEGILINSPITPLSQGQYWDVGFETAAALPFKTNGYHTVFFYGGSSRWRSMHRSMPRLGFDEILDMSDILKLWPEATGSDNGIHDEYLFRYAHRRLQELDREGKPVLMFMVSTSNHTPYGPKMLPPDYVQRTFDLQGFPETVLPEEKTVIALNGFFYASDQLGGFLDLLKESGLAEKTIVSATGDHYMRNFYIIDGAATAPWRDRVGFYLRVPTAYQSGAKHVPEAFGSHRDLFPTLYHRALSGARYFGFGEDLLAMDRTAERAVAMTDFSEIYCGREVAFHLANPQFFSWDETFQELVPSETPSTEFRAVVEKERARSALQDWVIRMQALQKEPSDQNGRM